MVSGYHDLGWSCWTVYVHHVDFFMKNIAAQIQSEMERLIFVAKRKYERMTPEEQQAFQERIKNMKL